MADCEKNVLDIPVSASSPASTEYVIFTLPDGTSVLRTWANVITGVVPDDEEIVVTASGGAINNGDSTFIRTNFLNRRVRLIRNNIPQSRINTGGSYYSFNPGTAQFTVVPAATTTELFQIQAY